MPIILGLLMLIGSIAANAKTIELTKYNHVVIEQTISEPLITYKTMEVFDKFTHLKKNSPFYVILNTQGGHVQSSLKFIELLNGLSNNVHTITIFSASSGYIISQLLGKRYILDSGFMFHHNLIIPTPEKSEQSLVEFNKRFEARLIKKLSDRVGRDLTDDIRNNLFLTSEDAIKGNYADEIVSIVCSKELMSTDIIIPLFVEQSVVQVPSRACPLILPFGGF